MIVGREIIQDRGELWLGARQRIHDLLAQCATHHMTQPVPAMPGHTVRELIIRVVATERDALDGDIHSTHAGRRVGGPRSAQPDAKLLAEWAAQASGVASLLRDDPRATRLLIDLVTHEHDLRTALDCPGARDSDAVVFAVEWLAQEFSGRLRAAGVPALRMTCEQWAHDTGPPPYHAIIVVDRFELFRALTGRRSAAEVRRWMWSADPAPYLPYLSVDGALRDTDLDEPDPDIPPEYAERLRRQSWREPVG